MKVALGSGLHLAATIPRNQSGKDNRCTFEPLVAICTLRCVCLFFIASLGFSCKTGEGHFECDTRRLSRALLYSLSQNPFEFIRLFCPLVSKGLVITMLGAYLLEGIAHWRAMGRLRTLEKCCKMNSDVFSPKILISSWICNPGWPGGKRRRTRTPDC